MKRKSLLVCVLNCFVAKYLDLCKTRQLERVTREKRFGAVEPLATSEYNQRIMKYYALDERPLRNWRSVERIDLEYRIRRTRTYYGGGGDGDGVGEIDYAKLCESEMTQKERF